MDYLEPILARNGQIVQVRFLEAQDGELLVDLFRRLSPTTRYKRFHVPVENFTAEEIAEQLPHYTNVDRSNHVALVALVSEEDGEAAIGVARFQRRPGVEEAEAAVVVRDDWQRQGIGAMLLDRLIAVALSAGIKRFCAWIQGNNRPAMCLVAGLRMKTTHHPDHGEDYIVMHLGAAQPEQSAASQESASVRR